LRSVLRLELCVWTVRMCQGAAERRKPAHIQEPFPRSGLGPTGSTFRSAVVRYRDPSSSKVQLRLGGASAGQGWTRTRPGVTAPVKTCQSLRARFTRCPGTKGPHIGHTPHCLQLYIQVAAVVHRHLLLQRHGAFEEGLANVVAKPTVDAQPCRSEVILVRHLLTPSPPRACEPAPA
jgi:hypothetical protein